ncbi:hypothetical protein AAEX28_12980 [Lentisphaerota bacterium WC36G]|nr:hypothetical protein LJT99_15805 [Lentisphaerae bacterium WC36]
MVPKSLVHKTMNCPVCHYEVKIKEVKPQQIIIDSKGDTTAQHNNGNILPIVPFCSVFAIIWVLITAVIGVLLLGALFTEGISGILSTFIFFLGAISNVCFYYFLSQFAEHYSKFYHKMTKKIENE